MGSREAERPVPCAREREDRALEGKLHPHSPGREGSQQLGLSILFSNIFENIDGLADFRIREYSQEYRCLARLFLKNIELFFSPLTVVDLYSQDIRKYSRRYNRGVYNLLVKALKTAYLPFNNKFWVDAG